MQISGDLISFFCGKRAASVNAQYLHIVLLWFKVTEIPQTRVSWLTTTVLTGSEVIRVS